MGFKEIILWESPFPFPLFKFLQRQPARRLVITFKWMSSKEIILAARYVSNCSQRSLKKFRAQWVLRNTSWKFSFRVLGRFQTSGQQWFQKIMCCQRGPVVKALYKENLQQLFVSWYFQTSRQELGVNFVSCWKFSSEPHSILAKNNCPFPCQTPSCWDYFR